MFDTMTMTKIVGGFCGMLLIFLLSLWAADTIYGSEGGEGEGEERQAYVIDTGEEESAEETDVAEVAVDFAAILAAADAGKGEKLFKACKACHKVDDGKNGVGPSLYGVVGRAVGSVEGYKYSGNLVAVAETWGPEELNGFLENPKGFAPSTKMTYKGMKDIEDRANLIAWLNSLDN